MRRGITVSSTLCKNCKPWDWLMGIILLVLKVSQVKLSLPERYRDSALSAFQLYRSQTQQSIVHWPHLSTETKQLARFYSDQNMSEQEVPFLFCLLILKGSFFETSVKKPIRSTLWLLPASDSFRRRAGKVIKTRHSSVVFFGDPCQLSSGW